MIKKITKTKLFTCVSNYYFYNTNATTIIALPKKRKRQANIAKAASKEPQDYFELVPKQ
jgi:hypothetical protein